MQENHGTFKEVFNAGDTHQMDLQWKRVNNEVDKCDTHFYRY